MRKLSLASLCFLIACGFTGRVQGADYARVTVASGEIRHDDLVLRYPGEARTNRVTTFELSLSEALGERWDGRLSLGFLDITQSANPLVAGQNLSGPFLGIGARGRLVEAGAFSLVFEAGYRYVDTDGHDGDQSVELRWHEVDASLLLQWQLARVPMLYIGGGVHSLDGDEITRGPVSGVQEVEADKDTSARLGLDFQVDPGGHIGVEIRTGIYEGGRLYFLRRF